MEGYTLNKKDGHLRQLFARFFGEDPQDVYSQFNAASIMHREELIRCAMGAIRFDGVPENWNEPYFKRRLLLNGYFAISDTPMGVLPLECSLTGVSVWNEPTEYIIVNPVFQETLRGVIDEDGAVVRLQYNYGNINDILELYSFMLASCDNSISVNLFNSKATMIAECSSEKEAKSFKLLYDQIAMGSPASFVKDGTMGKMNFLRPKDNYIAGDIQELKRNIKNEFLSLFGVNNANTMKRERMITDEVNANNEELVCNISHWKVCIQAGLDSANRIFGYDLHVSFPLAERKVEYGSGSSDNESIFRNDVES